MKPSHALTARWRIACFLAAAALINYADRSAMSSVFPSLRHELGLTDVQLGLISSLFLWSYAIGSPLAGVLADRFSRSRLILFSLTFWSLVTGAIGFSSNLTHLALLRVMLGFAECLYLPAAIALLADHHQSTTRGKAMSLHSIGLNIGVITGGAFAGYAAEHYGWRSGFYVLGTAGILLAILGKVALQDGPTRPANAKSSITDAFRYLVRTPSYYVMLSKSALSGVTIWIFLSWLPLYFKERFGFGLGQAGFAGTFMLQVATLLGIAVGGWLSDTVSSVSSARRMLIQSIAYALAAPFLLLFLTQPDFTLSAFAISCFSFLRGIGSASEQPTVCEIIPSHFRSTAVGFSNMCATAAGGAGVLLTGHLKGSVGLEGVFAGSAAIFLLAATILFVGFRFLMSKDMARARAAEDDLGVNRK